MCGIAGIVCTSKPDFRIGETLQRMADRLNHRGPDDEGYVLFDHQRVCTAGGLNTPAEVYEFPTGWKPVSEISGCNNDYFMGFAHRRLSVIDLSPGGHQPMCNDDGTIWIVCNGEIYNYIEIRHELEQNGFRFRTGSDVEVLVKAYEFWDIRCLDHLNGMWSFVLYDRKRNLVFGARDRFGVKPLYLFRNNNFLAFASEIKALLVLPADYGVNENALAGYFMNHVIEAGGQTLFSNVDELLPSHYFLMDTESGQFEVRKYFHLLFDNSGIFRVGEAQAGQMAEEVRHRLHDAVTLRLRSDVPVGFCLSGGLDSSSILGISSLIQKEQNPEILRGGLKAFTAVNNTGTCDERSWAGRMASAAKAEWFITECTSEGLFEELDRMIYHQDVPLLSTSTYAQNMVMKLADRNGVTILLDGQGGDELFGGYIPFYMAWYAELLKNGKSGLLLRELSSLGNSPLNKGILIRSTAKLIIHSMPGSGWKRRFAVNRIRKSGILSKDFTREHTGKVSLQGDYDADGLNSRLWNFFTGNYLKNLLRWEDRCSMQYGIESRTPFSDDLPLINYMFSLPAAAKIRNGWSKYLLRQGMSGILPEEIRLRKDKMGFDTPQDIWLRQASPLMKNIVLIDGDCDTEGVSDPLMLVKRWDSFFAPGSSSKQRDLLWKYCNYLIWKRIFFKK